MKHTITTIGYEGSTIGDFVAALRHASINVLIDVRELPLSRKKGSRKSACRILAASGIEYVHLRELGDPKDGRTAARAGNYHLFEGIFCRHMQTEAALRDITTAADLVSACRACLMCFECDHTKCHRSIVAERLANITQLTVTPLTVRDVRLRRIRRLTPSLSLFMSEFEGTSEAVILVKASPQVSKRHGETVCCAGVNNKGEWVRLYPVSFRSLDQASQFRRWDRIRFRWKRPQDDRRPESLRVDHQSIEIIGELKQRERLNFLSRLEVSSIGKVMEEGKTLALLGPST